MARALDSAYFSDGLILTRGPAGYDAGLSSIAFA